MSGTDEKEMVFVRKPARSSLLVMAITIPLQTQKSRRKRLLSSLMSGILLFVGLNCISADKMPDCAGIRPGTSADEARQLLKSHDPTLTVQTVEMQIPSLSEKPALATLFVQTPTPPSAKLEPAETLAVAITLPPNKPVVWKVSRSLRFEQGHERTRTALIGALSEKYVKESFTLDRGFGTVSCVWVFGADGALVEGPAAKECSLFCQGGCLRPDTMDTNLGGDATFRNKLRTIMFLARMQNTLPEAQDPQHCQSMTYVVAELSVATNRELVNQMQISVIDALLELKATEATRTLLREAETAKARQGIEKASGQQVPKL